MKAYAGSTIERERYRGEGVLKLFGFYHKPPAKRRRRRRRGRLLLVLFLGFVLLAAALLLLRQCQNGTGLFHEEDAGLTYIDDIPVYEDFLPEGAAARPGGTRRIRWVVIHETDNTGAGADAEAHNHFIHENGMTSETGWHYTVDDHQIYHHIPDDEPAYHAGDHMDDGGGNKNGIGVEMCVNADGDYEQTLKNAQKLAAHLLLAYDLTPDDLRKHQDFSGKNCPSQLLDNGRWKEFAQAVREEYERLRDAA